MVLIKNRFVDYFNILYVSIISCQNYNNRNSINISVQFIISKNHALYVKIKKNDKNIVFESLY